MGTELEAKRLRNELEQAPAVGATFLPMRMVGGRSMTAESYFTEKDLQYFMQYGLTMLQVQQFEQSLKQFA